MPDWIKSLTGRTLRARILELRRARAPVLTEQIDLIAELDTLANQSAITVNTMREQYNKLRLATVRAKQIVMQLRRDHPDIEL